MNDIIINKDREENNDLVIICGDSRFKVEKAILACHSTVFADMLKACNNSKTSLEITFSDSPLAVESFLRIIYGQLPSYGKVWKFDHCVDVIELGNKYFADCVVDRGVLQMCRTFEVIACQKPEEKIDSRYGKACILKFFNIWIRVQKRELPRFPSFRFIELSFRGLWEKWLKRCSCKPQTDKQGYQYSGYSRYSLVNFVDEKNCKFFSADDLLMFQKIMEKYVITTDMMSIL